MTRLIANGQPHDVRHSIYRPQYATDQAAPCPVCFRPTRLWRDPNADIDRYLPHGTPECDGSDQEVSTPLTSVLPQETTAHRQHVLPGSPPTRLPAEPPETAFRHSGWRHARKLILTAIAQSDHPCSTWTAMTSCGARAWILHSTTPPLRYKVQSQHCHSRWCVPCAAARSIIIRTNLIAQCEAVLQSHRDKNSPPLRFITLTMRSQPGEELRPLIERLTKAWQRLRRHRAWTKTQLGGACILEIRYYAERDRWHPHLHVISEGRFLHHDVLRQAWLQATTDSSIVDIRSATNHTSAARYLTDYLTKPIHADLLRDEPKLIEAINAMRGRKLISTYGTWAKVSLTRTDTPPTDEWQALAPLAEIINRAREGDPYATYVIARLVQHQATDPTLDAPDESVPDPPD